MFQQVVGPRRSSLCVDAMPRGKDISGSFKEEIMVANQSGRGYKTTSKLFSQNSSTARKIPDEWKTFRTVKEWTSKLIHPLAQRDTKRKRMLQSMTGILEEDRTGT